MAFDSRLAGEVVESLVTEWETTSRLRDGLDPDGTSYADTVARLDALTIALERIVGELRAIESEDPRSTYAVRRAIDILARTTPARRHAA